MIQFGSSSIKEAWIAPSLYMPHPLRHQCKLV